MADVDVLFERISGEIKSLQKDLERVQKSSDECNRFQKEADKKMAQFDTEMENCFKEAGKRMDLIESLITLHKKEHEEHQKSKQAKQWALWMMLIGTAVSSVAGLIVSSLKG